MILKFLIVFIISHGVSSSVLAKPMHSAYRHPQENFRHTIKRYVYQLRSSNPDFSGNGSALDVHKYYQQLNLNKLPNWKNMNLAKKFFFHLRDARMLRRNIQFPRRISWLYPQDGCWLRAEIAKTFLAQWKLPPIAKVFIFGNLNVKTSNAPSGEVSWWYHVAPAIRVGKQAYIFDPAINPEGPTPLTAWILKQVPKISDATFSICHQHTFSPSSSCEQAEQSPFKSTLNMQYGYLEQEWDNILVLKRDPHSELGKYPPWKL